MSVIAPYLSQEEVIMEFALLYPKLMEKVHEGLSEFFKGFIAKFNEIHKA